MFAIGFAGPIPRLSILILSKLFKTSYNRCRGA